MTRQIKTHATLSSPIDMKKDQVEETRRFLGEMNDKAERFIDKQTGRTSMKYAHNSMCA
jgi:hypothetical protein